MKVVNSYIFRAVCALLIGILLVSNPERMTGLLVQVIGGLFLLSGLVSLVSYAMFSLTSKSDVKPAFPLVGLGSCLFGVVLGFFSSFFVVYLMYALGLIMVVAGINQLWNLFRLRQFIPFRWYVFLGALVVFGLGVFVLCYPMESASLPFVLLGACFILYGVSEFVNGVRWRKYHKQHEAEVVEEAEVVKPTDLIE